MDIKNVAASLTQALGIPQSELARWFGLNRSQVSGNPSWQDAYCELEIRHLTEKIDFLRQLEG